MSHILPKPKAAAPVVIPAAALAPAPAATPVADPPPATPVTPAAATPAALAAALPPATPQVSPAAQMGNVAKGAATTAAGLGYNATNLTGPAAAGGGVTSTGFAGATTSRKSLIGS